MAIRYPLSHPQKRIWYTEQLHPGTGMWNNAGTLKLQGKLEEALLEQAILQYIRDNPSIRLRFSLEDGQPFQYFSEEIPTHIDRLDFSARGEAALYEWDTAMTQAPLSAVDSPLFYFAVIRLGPESGGMYVKVHHLISDAFSLVLMTNQVMENYEALLESRPAGHIPAASYADYLRQEEQYLSSKAFGYDRQYWNSRFAVLPEEPTSLKLRKDTGTAARRKAFVIDKPFADRIRGFCEENRISIFALFLSCLSLYINRITGKDDMVFSAPVYNRTTSAMLEVFGMFVSTVPIRVQIRDDLTFSEYAGRVSNEWFSVLKHQRYPYDLLIKDLREQSRGLENLYDITLSYQYGTLEKQSSLFRYEGRWHFSGHQANPLNIHINDRENDGRLILDYDYLTPMFAPREMDYIHDHLLNILRDVLQNPEKKLYQLTMLSEEERGRVLVRFNDTRRDYPESLTALQMVLDQARRKPYAPALSWGEERMTFGTLLEKAGNAAGVLRERGLERGAGVALWLPRSPAYVTALLAVELAGGCYLPMDTSLPRERIRAMLEDSGASLVITTEDMVPACPPVCPVLCWREDFPAHPLPQVLPAPADPAYMIFTSGSTGRPKGVLVSHGALANFVQALGEIWNFSPNNACGLCAASVSFDLSVMEVWGTLCHGARLAVCREETLASPSRFAQFLLRQGVDRMLLTPGRMELLLSDSHAGQALEGFREIATGGDVLTEGLLRRIREKTTGNLYNMYGPTENTVVATCKKLLPGDTVNIGRPLANVEVYILDRHRNPVPIGVPGELYIGGRSLAEGYVRRLDLTEAAFIPHPFKPGQRLYRTGDLARWYPLGDIEFLGRADAQVKLRGFRVELGEIENALEKLPGIQQAAVIDRTDEGGRKYLAAYLRGNPPPVPEIKAALARELPVYMVPGVFMTLPDIPLTPAGKVDRRALPQPLPRTEDAFVPPVTVTEEMLARLWQKELHLPRIGRDDHFYEIGGDSLTIVRVNGEVQSLFQVDLPLEDICRQPTLREWARRIDTYQGTGYRAITPAEPGADYPASTAQERMFILSRDEAGSMAYHIPVLLTFSQPPDVPRLLAALQGLTARHDVLRTSLRMTETGLRQRILPEVPLTLEEVSCTPAGLTAAARKLLRPFDLEHPPLLRAALLHTGKRDALLLDMHHAVCDGRTAEILLEELAALYRGESLPEKGLEYKDYAVWERQWLTGPEAAEERDFWKETLSGELPLLDLPTDMPRSGEKKYGGKQISAPVPADCGSRLRQLARERNVTLHTLMLAAYALFLRGHCGQDEVMIGTPAAGRNRGETADIAGMFVGTLPIRLRMEAKSTFAELLERTRAASMAALGNAAYPLDRMLRDLRLTRAPGRNPLFDTMLVYRQDTPLPAFGESTVALTPLDPGSAKMDLTLEIHDDGTHLECVFEYDRALFLPQTGKRFIRRFLHLLEQLPEAAEVPVEALTLQDTEETREIRCALTGAPLPLPAENPEELFLRAAAAHPDKIALLAEKACTYRELAEKAGSIARALTEAGVKPGDPVVVCLPREMWLPAAILGVWMAGAAYLPVDPAYPPERIRFTIEDSGASVMLGERGQAPAFLGLLLDPREITCPPLTQPRQAGSRDAGYVIYTSGSTGRPKGVTLTREGLRNLYAAASEWDIYHEDTVSVSVTTAAFDIFIIDGLLPLLFGGTVSLADEEETRQPARLAARMLRDGVTFIQTTPTRMGLLLEDASFRTAAGHLRAVGCAGEVFPETLLRRIRRVCPRGTRIYNGYGPSETTVYSTFKALDTGYSVNIGRPIANTDCLLLDGGNRPVPYGVKGELYIGGRGVGRGYIRRPELTEARFLRQEDGSRLYRTGDICRLLPDGCLEICGRTDDQIKLHGLRIELGEIQTRMKEIPGVTDAVVLARGSGETQQLYACYTGTSLPPETLRNALLQSLPVYMVPSAFLWMEAFPQTPNGKVDKKALPCPDTPTPTEGTLPITPEEKRMARIWKQVLGRETIHREDNFFSLGGDSLGVIRVQAALTQYGWELRTQDFYEKQTLAALCSQTPSEKRREVPAGPRRVRLAAAPLPPADLSATLLTGATGYLGAQLCGALARAGHRVYCPVRAGDASSARARMVETLAYYFPGEVEALLAQVTAFPCDLSRGLTLPEGITFVLHAAARTDHIGYRSAFEAANVTASSNVLKACMAAKVPLAHISTLSVCGSHFRKNPEKNGIFTENDLSIGQETQDNEYTRSKYMAEALMLAAADKGFPLRIFRMGNLGCRAEDGLFQRNPERNAFARRVQGLAKLGCLDAAFAALPCEITPVEQAAEALLLLLSQPSRRIVWHIAGPSLRYEALAGILGEEGCPVTLTDADTLRKKLRTLAREDAGALSGLLADGTEARIQPDCRITDEALASLGFRWAEPMAYARRYLHCICTDFQR